MFGASKAIVINDKRGGIPLAKTAFCYLMLFRLMPPKKTYLNFLPVR
ncbi:hypothetical protein PROVALCAL_02927 [Providencia alcalifaciens DSM 30120]|uniref:Uncharacterized protein n=1 Tax=Providencia alcalifaciens DSM 30120 TaxID=520999 RepID=B6XHT9_9GAMM|nr:hypothetical protein PROVALCAL_02927 [Providencia alcalifaciens DSM 30120]